MQQVIIGDYNTGIEEHLEKEINVKKIVVHESYIHVEEPDYFKMGSYYQRFNIQENYVVTL